MVFPTWRGPVITDDLDMVPIRALHRPAEAAVAAIAFAALVLVVLLDMLRAAGNADGGAGGEAATPSTSGAAHPSRGVRERIARFDL